MPVSRARAAGGGLVLDVESEDLPAFLAVSQQGLSGGTAAVGKSLLMPVQSCPAPAHEARCVLGRAPFGPCVLGDCQFVCNDNRIGGWPAEACAVLPRRDDAGIDALNDQLTFVL
jgi:hypothetical protein